MNVGYGKKMPPPREHPWTVVEGHPGAKYWDFKAHPEKIPLVLEDFKPWQSYPAIQRFYELLLWLNGTDSSFESNDCGMQPPRRDDEAPGPIRRCFAINPIMVYARLTIIYRDLGLNVGESFGLLKLAIFCCLRKTELNIPVAVEVGEWQHLFTSINKEGKAVTLQFWAWGDDEAQSIDGLRLTFEAVHRCLKDISDMLASHG